MTLDFSYGLVLIICDVEHFLEFTLKREIVLLKDFHRARSQESP